MSQKWYRFIDLNIRSRSCSCMASITMGRSCMWVVSCLMMAMIQVSLGRSSLNTNTNTNTNDRVSLELYYESLCPYSASFVVEGLAPIFKNGIIDIVELKLYPWGNAKIRPDSSFVCQHGPNECLLNTAHACAILASPTLSDHFPFIECVERLVLDRKYTHWETCLNKSDLDPYFVKDCTTTMLGTQLELKYAAATGALEPPHEYVPWVVVNGQPLYEEYDNFTSYVCKAYEGSLPSACNASSSDNFLRDKTLHSHPVCYIDKPTRSWLPQMADRDFI